MTYFTQDFIDFFQELNVNNEREWFHGNKKRYEKSVKDPFVAFVQVMIDRIAAVNPDVKITPKEAMFRINRDIRFSKDKRPYKTHMAAVVSEGGRRNMQIPGIYFQFGGSGIMIAGGLHAPDKENLYKVREAIAENPEALNAVLSEKKYMEMYNGELPGEQNKVLPKEFKAAREVQPLIANKSFHYVKKYEDASILLRPDLPDWVMAHYHAGDGLNTYLKMAIGFLGV